VLATVDEAVILEAGRRLAALKALLAVDPEAPPVDAETQPSPNQPSPTTTLSLASGGYLT